MARKYANPARLYDDECRRIIAQDPGAAVAWWLMASFLYYHDDNLIISDDMFEDLSRFLAQRWEAITHRHKGLIGLDDLAAGSGFALSKERYPQIVIAAARRIYVEGVRDVSTSSMPPRSAQLLLF